MQLKYDRLLGNEKNNSDFWPSFTDMLTTILLVIILVFTSMVGNYTTLVNQSEQALDEQKKKVEQQSEKLTQAENRIEGILGIKGDIIDTLQQSFEENNIAIRINPDTGDIYVDSNILFDYGSSELKEDAKLHIKEFVPLYINSLFKYEENIEEIIVEGHTDNIGNYMYNLRLSQDRALSVVQYILGDDIGDFDNKDKMRVMITANGRSFSKPIINNDGTVNTEASRRVVFKFRTTLENALKQEIGEDNSSQLFNY